MQETSLCALDNFYSNMLRSYAFVNNLHYEWTNGVNLPTNLWGHPLLPKINLAFARAGFCTLSDLPLTIENKIDFLTVQNKIQSTKNKGSVFMVCYSLQNKFGLHLPSKIPSSADFGAELLDLCKKYLREHTGE